MESNNNIQSDTNQEEISIVEIFFQYLRYWKWFILSFVICVGIALLYLRYTTSEYQVTSTILIKDEKKGTGVDMTAFSDLGIISQEGNLDNEIEVLYSKTLMKSVVDSLKIGASYYKKGRFKSTEIYKLSPVFVSVSNLMKPGSFMIDSISENAISIHSAKEEFKRIVEIGNDVDSPWGLLSFRLNPFGTASYPIEVVLHSSKYLPYIQINPVNKTSSVVNVSMITACPDKGRDIINTLIDHYNQNAINEKNTVARNTNIFIDERLAVISGELEVAERDVQYFKQSQGITDLQAQGQLLLASSTEYDKKVTDAEIQLNILRSIKSFLMNPANVGNVAPANVGLTDITILSLIQTYNDELLAKNKSTAGMTANNPVLIEYNDRIASLRDNLLKGIGISESSMELTIRELRKQENMYTGKARGLSAQERESQELYRQKNIKETLFIYLLQKKEETGLSLALATPNAKIIDYASVSSNPVKPKTRIILLAAILLGIIFPICIIYIRNLFDNKIHTKEDVIRIIKAPFLGDIPVVKGDDPFPVLKVRSSVAERFRVIASNLEFIVGGEKTKIISITSSTSGEGKSFFSRNLALSLATSGKKTLLIDMDLRKSVMTKVLSLQAGKGSAIFLSIPETEIIDVIDNSKSFHKNLDIIPVRVFPPNPAELLASDRLDFLFRSVANNYDYIIVDTAPIGLVADAYRINQFANATIYVTRANYTFKQSLRDVQELYRDNKLNHLTCVLNAVDSSSKRYGYGEYKHNYYTEDK